MLLKISQISQENICVEACTPATLLVRLQRMCFLVKFTKLFRKSILKYICKLLLWKYIYSFILIFYDSEGNHLKVVHYFLGKVLKQFWNFHFTIFLLELHENWSFRFLRLTWLNVQNWFWNLFVLKGRGIINVICLLCNDRYIFCGSF